MAKMDEAKLQEMAAAAVKALAEGHEAKDEVLKAQEKAAKAAKKAEAVRLEKAEVLKAVEAQIEDLQGIAATLRTEIGLPASPVETPKAGEGRTTTAKGRRGRSGSGSGKGSAFDWEALKGLKDSTPNPKGYEDFGLLNYVAGFHGIPRSKPFQWKVGKELHPSAAAHLQGIVDGLKVSGEAASPKYAEALKASGLKDFSLPKAAV